ncbi:MAG: hypothetical protein R2822_14060 [Spirosomataceae bacterium]
MTRHHPFYFAVNGKTYVGFGHGSAFVDGNNIYKDFYRISSKQRQWKQLRDFPDMGRVAGTQFDHDGYGYILSGARNRPQRFKNEQDLKYFN